MQPATLTMQPETTTARELRELRNEIRNLRLHLELLARGLGFEFFKTDFVPLVPAVESKLDIRKKK